MRSITLCISTIVLLHFTSLCHAGKLTQLEWSALIDQSVQEYNDPYQNLSPEQLASLITVAQQREKAKQGEAIDKDKLSREAASLTEQGIDIDELIAQRWVVAERRQRAATSGNQAVDGRKVILSGFAIGAPADADGTATAYLVPERGMCSHMHPPSPNQMVRLRLPDNWQPDALYQPIQVSGLLSIAPTTHTIQVVDGPMPMHATFSMDVSNIEQLDI